MNLRWKKTPFYLIKPGEWSLKCWFISLLSMRGEGWCSCSCLWANRCFLLTGHLNPVGGQTITCLRHKDVWVKRYHAAPNSPKVTLGGTIFESQWTWFKEWSHRRIVHSGPPSLLDYTAAEHLLNQVFNLGLMRSSLTGRQTLSLSTILTYSPQKTSSTTEVVWIYNKNAANVKRLRPCKICLLKLGII